jgi:hypothetical protein
MPADAGIQESDTIDVVTGRVKTGWIPARTNQRTGLRGNAVFVPGGDDNRSVWVRYTLLVE